MPRRFKNRRTEEIIAFLLAHGFRRSNTVGDDEIYTKPGWHLVCKVTLNQKSTPIGTMQQIKRCSGYSSREWIGWWKDKGYGE
ncbi:MAG: hypothetical protein COV79_02310 [Parcubacteria group bacterium CG11_big_fil_rev_8_21_14_0_20_41_14]|nr:MAG: hypothetical protein COV79_02310 [Parcubacteria group bacterium CG11_big_fil_rev_8_21_14_0_20_41_14]PIR57177.1 MAG: hypothetical protein COU72_02335 [Parcubacteria group bacterium CG10_big_fil_rev_8_21_14_0_10_41_35]